MTDAKGTKELRRFGLVLGAAFAVLGAVSAWRGRAPAPYLLGVTTLLWAVALLAPARLRLVERAWMALAERLAIVSTTVILTLTFFLLITPIAVIRRLSGHDDLGLRFDRGKRSYWSPVEPDGPSQRPDKPY